MARRDEMIQTPALPPGVLDSGPYDEDYSFGASAEDVANDPDGEYRYDQHSGRYIKLYEGSTEVDHEAVDKFIGEQAQAALDHFKGRSPREVGGVATRSAIGAEAEPEPLGTTLSREEVTEYFRYVMDNSSERTKDEAFRKAGFIKGRGSTYHVERAIGLTLGYSEKHDKDRRSNPLIVRLIDDIVEVEPELGAGFMQHLEEKKKAEELARVPKALLERSRARRKALGIKAGGHIGSLAVSGDEFDRKLSGMVELDSAMACDLLAVEIRRSLLSRLTTVEGSLVGEEYETPFTEIYYEDGLYRAKEYTRTEGKWRYVTADSAGAGKMVRSAVWLDVDTEKRRRIFGTKVKAKTTEKDIKELPIYMGLSTDQGYLPLLKSMLVKGECHIIFPFNKETDGDSYNRKELLNLARGFFVDGNEGQLIELLQELAKLPGVDKTVPLAMKYLEQKHGQISDRLDKTMYKILNKAQNLRTDTVRTDRSSSLLSVIQTVAKNDDYPIDNGGVDLRGVLRLGKRQYMSKITGMPTNEFTLYSGLDETRYGDKAIAYPEFIYTVDELNPPRVEVVEPNGDVVEATEEDRAVFMEKLAILYASVAAGPETDRSGSGLGGLTRYVKTSVARL